MAAALALFDFDGTMLPGDSIVAYTRFALERGSMSRGAYLACGVHALGYLLGVEDENRSKTHALAFRRSRTEAEREALDRSFADALIERVYPEAAACVQECCRKGCVPLLVTASPICYMRFVGPALGFADVLATPLRDGFIAYDNCKGEEKIRRVNQWLLEHGLEADFAASRAYGDSKSDLPMLRLCGHPTLVNPKAALRKAAEDAPIVYWK